MTRRDAFLIVAAIAAPKTGLSAKTDWHPLIQWEIPVSGPDPAEQRRRMEECRNAISTDGLARACISQPEPEYYDCLFEIRWNGMVVRFSAAEFMESLGAVKE